MNLSLCEAYYYFGGHTNDGVWSLLKPMILVLNSATLNSFVEKIDNELIILREEHCDIQMRHSAAHYNKPIERYKNINDITEEDKYCKAASQFMLIHTYILQVSKGIIDIIKRIAPKNEESSAKPMIHIFDAKAFVENDMAIKLSSNEQIARLSGESLIKTSDSIDFLYKRHLMYEGVKKFITSKNIQLSESIETPHKLLMLRMMAGFIRCDLTCAIRAYLNSKYSMERSLQLRRIFLIEVSALTHLYGYNKETKTKSLWMQLVVIDIEGDEKERVSLQSKLEELTSNYDAYRRNLYTHFREGETLNIQKRCEAYRKLNHLNEINKALEFIQLCKEIEDYTVLRLRQIEKKEQQKSKELREKYRTMDEKIRNNIKNSKLSEAMKAQVIMMIDDMERNYLHYFENDIKE
jgi:uncharacterized membrane-anchored protein YhcB (DUF1043 family)